MNPPAFVVNIPPFNGDYEQLESFITHVKDLQTINNWSEKQTLTYANAHLAGPAKRFNDQKVQYKPHKTIQELFTTLREQFPQPNTCKAIHDFNSLVMLPAETIRNLSHRIDCLAQRAHPSIKDQNALDSIKFNKLCSALPSSYKIHILQNGISKYDEAIKKATLLQDCEINNQIIYHANFSDDSSTKFEKLKEEIAQFKRSVQNMNAPKTQSNARNDSQNKFSSDSKFQSNKCDRLFQHKRISKSNGHLFGRKELFC